MFADDDLVLDLFARVEVRVGNAVEAPRETREGADVRVDRRAPVVFQQVIVDVDPIHGRPGGVDLIEEGEVVVYEVR